MRKTSIIIVTYNHFEYTKDCIESIYKYTDKDTYEIIVVDNCSTDETRNWLKMQKDIKVILNKENLGFPKACNQGIERANSENDILLLNNDTIVTTNWLKNLKICLYSDSVIGATGAVSNHDENEQGVDFTYDDFDMMQALATENNISDAKRWEEKIFLIGFCILIRREVITKIKYLDEKYTPGYIEDNDLSLQIIKEGYKLMLCHDAFIHHYLGTAFRKNLDTFYKVLNHNRKYFIEKWGFSTFCFDEIKNASLKIMKDSKKVLEFDCGIGTTLLKIKYLYPNATIHGIESDISKIQIAKKIATVYSSLEEVKEDYDCILIGNLLERVVNPKKLLNTLKKYLKKDGYIIGEIQNAASLENILFLLKNTWYYLHKDKLHCYTFKDIENLLNEVGYKVNYIFSWYKNFNDEEKQILLSLKKKSPNNYETVYYSFRFQL